MRRLPLSKGIYLLPNLCTTGSLFFGFYSIVHAIGHDYYRASMAIFISAIFDLLDGRIARITRSESDFGVEYDSLVDLASFGLAPGILLYTWALKGFNRIGWLAAFLYFACGALRLARYNVQIETVEKRRFQGLPIPLAAMAIAGLVLLCDGKYAPLDWKGPLALALPLILAPLMVSRIRYRSFKDFDPRSRNGFSLLVLAVGLIILMATNTDLVPFFVFLAYILSGPIEEAILWWKGRDKGRSWRRKTAAKKMAVLAGGSDEKAAS